MKKIFFFLLLCIKLNAQSVEVTNEKIQFNPSVYLRSTHPTFPEIGLRSKTGTSFSALRFENESGMAYFRLVGTSSESRIEVFNRFILQINNGANGVTDRLTVLNNGKVGISTNSPQSDFEVNGFSKLGSDAPAIKVKKLTTTTSSNQGGQVTILHGLTESKILSISVMVEYGSGQYVHPAYLGAGGYQFEWFSGSGGITIWNRNSNSSNILSKPCKILITYEE